MRKNSDLRMILAACLMVIVLLVCLTISISSKNRYSIEAVPTTPTTVETELPTPEPAPKMVKAPVPEPPKDPEVLLAQIDAGLDKIESDPHARVGSYTDWFIPVMSDLKDRGVARKDLEGRIDRLVELASAAKYLSSFERDLVEADGIKGLREDATTNIFGATATSK